MDSAHRQDKRDSAGQRRALKSVTSDVAALACGAALLSAKAAGGANANAAATRLTPIHAFMTPSSALPHKLPAVHDPHKVETAVDCRRISIGSVEGGRHDVIRNQAHRSARGRHIDCMGAGCGAGIARPGNARTASGFTQLVMAIMVYGASALVVGAGLIGALRK